MQESRLFKIVYYLIEKGKSTAPELAQKFEVSVRTIYRDIDVISSAGIPIYATQAMFLSNFKVTVIRFSCFIDVLIEGIVSGGVKCSSVMLRCSILVSLKSR